MGGLLVERLASGARARRRPDRMADNPPDPHYFLLFLFFSRFLVRLWLV